MVEIIKALQSWYQELELVFQKGETNDTIKQMLSELTKNAYEEAKNFCPYLKYKGKTLSPDEFEQLQAIEKAEIIRDLGENLGLKQFNTMESLTGKMQIELSRYLPYVLSCTMFSILNRIENLDGAINAAIPKVEITILVPLGGKKGLAKCEMLLVLLYPWITIHELSSNETAVTLAPISTPQQGSSSIKKEEKQPKKSFWKNLFKKK